MRAAAITAQDTVGVLDEPLPKALGDLVVVKIRVTPMGTEFQQRKTGVRSDAMDHDRAGVTSVHRTWTTVCTARPLLDLPITHVMRLEDVSAAMDLQDAAECGKVVLLPHGESDDPVAA